MSKALLRTCSRPASRSGRSSREHRADSERGSDEQAARPPGRLTQRRQHQADDHPRQHHQQRPGPQRPRGRRRLVPGPAWRTHHRGRPHRYGRYAPSAGAGPPACGARSALAGSSLARPVPRCADAPLLDYIGHESTTQLGPLHHVGEQHRAGHRPDAPGHRRHPRGHLVDAGVDVADQTGLGAGDADVDADRAGLDHVGGDQAGAAGGGHDDVGRRVCPARSVVPVWHRVTVAFSLRRVSSRPSGRPTVMPRPITQTSAPPSGMPLRRSSSTTPRGVHGSGPGAPSTNRPRLHRVQTVGVLVRVDGQQGGELVAGCRAAAAGRCSRCRPGRRSARRSSRRAPPRWSRRAARPGSKRCRPARSRGACRARRSGYRGRRRPAPCPAPG